MALISQEQNLRQFVTTHLADIIEWSKHVRPDPEKKSTGDVAYIVVATPYNRYKLSVCSAYVEPPAGAPLQCRALGTVTFYDPADGKQIVGPKNDQTYTDISKHIHTREYTDAIAVAKRELAEAAPEAAGSARVRMAGLIERGAKWLPPTTGVALTPASQLQTAEPAPVTHTFNDPGHVHGRMTADQTHANISAYLAERAAASDPRDKRAPFIGAPVIYITNPGEAIGGQHEIPALCVKVHSPDRISLFMTPDHSEPSYRDGLARRGTDAGNGRVHVSNCWDFNPHWLAEQSRIKTLETDLHHLHETVAALARRVTTLETKARTEAIAKPKTKKPAADKADAA